MQAHYHGLHHTKMATVLIIHSAGLDSGDPTCDRRLTA